MNPKPLLCLWIALAASSCVNTQLPPETTTSHAADLSLKQAEVKTTPAEQRAALYLDSAAKAEKLLGSPQSGEEARRIYNQAATELTVLLRSSGNGAVWNHPLIVTSGGTTWHLRFAKGTRDGTWDPAYFTSFTAAADVPLKTIRNRDIQQGVGGTLVGIHKTSPLEPFSPLVGVTAPVTAVLDFKGSEATLSLINPNVKPKAGVAGATRTLEADFSAPLAYYPQKSEIWEGLMGAIRVSDYMKTTGLYMLQPYDPDRIPLIFVHGLISTPRMWRNVVNELEKDPALRGRFQCWVFGYPTGNPPAYSAMRLREELARLHVVHPDAKNYVLVGHSMGGLLSRMQATTVTRESWNVIGKDRAEQFFHNVKKGDLVDRCAVFHADPHVDRIIFICTPHRGSDMAVGSIGEFAIKLIALPIDITAGVASSLGNSLSYMTGDPHRMPNSVTGLSPTNPMLKVLDQRPIEAPYHTILGDRGKNDTPNSSDGVVNYWSSHLSKAKSEKIVPGPHGSCELPETLDEVRRILHEHLKEKGGARLSRKSNSTIP